MINRAERVEQAQMPEAVEWICPRCAYPLDKVAEGNTLDLWECAQCGYVKVVKGERQ